MSAGELARLKTGWDTQTHTIREEHCHRHHHHTLCPTRTPVTPGTLRASCISLPAVVCASARPSMRSSGPTKPCSSFPCMHPKLCTKAGRHTAVCMVCALQSVYYWQFGRVGACVLAVCPQAEPCCSAVLADGVDEGGVGRKGLNLNPKHVCLSPYLQ
jgi:hypothetical protein